MQAGISTCSSDSGLMPADLVRRNATWALLGNITYSACQWGVLVVLAKVGNAEMVGQYALAVAITAPVVLCANLALRQVQATDAKQEFQFSEYCALRLATTATALSVIAGAAFSVRQQAATAAVILFVGVAKALESLSDLIYGRLQQQEHLDRIARSLMLKGLASLVLLGLAVYLSNSLIYGAMSIAVSTLTVLLLYDFPSLWLYWGTDHRAGGSHTGSDSKPAWLPCWDRLRISKLFKLSLPLGVTAMLISLNGNIPYYFLQHFYGEQTVGMYAAMASLAAGGSMLICAFGESASPRLAKYYAAGQVADFQSLLLNLVGISAALGGVAVATVYWWGSEIMRVLYRPDYAVHHEVFMWIIAAAGLGYIGSSFGYALTAARYMKVQVPLFFVTTAITTIACTSWIPVHGMKGSAQAMFLSVLFSLIVIAGLNLNALYGGTFRLRRGYR
jgi:O-antigen/teichoic acid export membrane protein